MKAYLKIPATGIFTLLLAFVFSISLQAQSTDKNSEKDKPATEYHELIKFEKSYTLEKEKEQKSFASTITGIERKSPEHVFLAENVVSTDSSELKKAESEKPGENREDYEYAYSGTFQSSDVTFVEGSESSGGSSIGFTGSGGPGCGSGIAF